MKKNKITKEFKAEAVRMAKRLRAQGKSYKHIAQVVGVSHQTVRQWLVQATIDEGKGPAGATTTTEKEEYARALRENRELRRENDFLKQAAAYFAKVQ